jgi:hypothetical protein
MTNTNCLADIKCPACGNEDSFRIAATSLFTVTDDGTDDYADVHWDDDSYADCPECHRHGTLRDFRDSVSEQPYFRGPSGTRYRYAEIADRIRREAPHTLGKHISVQLEAIGLLDEMTNGTTPCALPFTFAEAPEASAAERHRNAASKLLKAVQLAESYLADDLDEDDETEMRIFNAICDARAAAVAVGIVLEPTAPRLLASLEAVLPYAEAERTSLCEAWRRDRDRAVNVELHACDLALGDAAVAIALAKRAGILPAANGQPLRFEFTHEPEENPDRAYVMVDGKFDVKIIRTDEGVVVDVYPRHGIDVIASTYAFDIDAEPEAATAEEA